MKIRSIIPFFFPVEQAFAHCDVPCGIYDPHAAQVAAQTVLTMVEKIEALPQEPSIERENSLIRMVVTKEKHAQKCKKELLILWTDYFKKEHLEQFPSLHETFWQAAKLCSQNKQHVDKALAQKLVNAVDEIASMFQQTKKA